MPMPRKLRPASVVIATPMFGRDEYQKRGNALRRNMLGEDSKG